MVTYEELIHAPRLKIQRASEHIGDLNRKVEAYVASKPIEMVVRQDVKARERSLRIKSEQPIPDEFSLIAGDAVHNLRSALDLIIFGLIGDKAQRPEGVQFPFAKRAEGLQNTITNREVALAGPKVVRLIKLLKPYGGGNERLYGLHTLDICDKHKLILTTRRFPFFTFQQLWEIDPEMDGMTPDRRPIGDGIVNFIVNDDMIYRYPMRPSANRAQRRKARDFERKANIQPTVRVALGKGLPFDGEDLVAKLAELAEYTAKVVHIIGKTATR